MARWRIPGISFSLKRALGLTALRQKVSKASWCADNKIRHRTQNRAFYLKCTFQEKITDLIRANWLGLGGSSLAFVTLETYLFRLTLTIRAHKVFFYYKRS